MLNQLLNLKPPAAETATSFNRRMPRPEHLAPSQDTVAVTAAQDSLLILRDFSVVAAVGFGSMSHAMLDGNELLAKLDGYRRLLKYVRFDFQLLVGTRPQNLRAYQAKMARNLERLGQLQGHVDTLLFRLPDYVRTHPEVDATHFREAFGFASDDLFGVPGEAHSVARVLSQPYAMAAAVENTDAPDAASVRTVLAADFVALCEQTANKLSHWQQVLTERLTHVETVVANAQAPVRTFYLVTSFNPRLITNMTKTPLTASELQRASEELDRRCAQLSEGLAGMNLTAWRVTHDELIDEIRHFYHPGTKRDRPELTLDRSVGMQLARVR